MIVSSRDDSCIMVTSHNEGIAQNMNILQDSNASEKCVAHQRAGAVQRAAVQFQTGCSLSETGLQLAGLHLHCRSDDAEKL